MKILVIGGTRYMGRIMVQRLLEQGDDVIVFSRGITRPGWWDRVGHIQGDRTHRDDFNTKLRGESFDAVVDTQAYRREDGESAIGTFDGKIGRYLFVSTGSVYLDGKLDFFNHSPFREDDVKWDSLEYTYPDGEDPYGVCKRHCEKWLNENSKVPYTIVRIPAIMGWDDPTARTWWWVQRALDGQGVVVPSEHRGPFRTLYSADGAANFIRALKSPNTFNQTYHIAMQEVMTIERWADLIWNAAGHASAVSFVPTEVIQKSLKSYAPPLSRALPYIHDLSKAKRDFAFTTTPVKEWVQTTVDWYGEKRPERDSAGYERRSEELRLAGRWNNSFGKLVSES